MFVNKIIFQTSIEVLKTSDVVVEISEGEKNNIFKYLHNGQEVVIHVHHIIDNGSILFVRLFENNYDDEILLIIPYLIYNYFTHFFSSSQYYIFYTDKNEIMEQYRELVTLFHPTSFQSGQPVYDHSKKYMYIQTSHNKLYKTPFNDLIEYMDGLL